MFKRLAALTATILFPALLAVSCGEYMSGGVITVNSPDGKIEFNFELKGMPPPYPDGNNMYFRVAYNGNPLLRESPLGLGFGDQGVVIGSVVITGVQHTSGTESYDTPLEKQASVSMDYNETVISMREKDIPAKTFDLIIRAFDEGVAFRYHFPEQEPKFNIPSAEHTGFMKEFVLTDEFTGYYFPEGTEVNATAMMIPPVPPHNYEARFTTLKTTEISRDSSLAMPVVLTYPDGAAMCIAEAALEPTYTASFITGSRNMENALNTVLVPREGEKEAKAMGEVPFSTPWRVLMIGESAGKLTESNIITALSEPSKISDPSWIVPGKASWDWWNGRVVSQRGRRYIQGGFETDTYKTYIEFSAENGLEYCLIDAGWYGGHEDVEADITVPVEDIDMQELTRYADSLGVGLILWLNWENVQKQMDEAFSLYEEWGIKGVKIDYMNRDDQEMIRFYHEVTARAAEHRLLVDFHGAYRPAGMRRTWPNLITREGVLGLEYLRWSDWADPEHNVTIPYTRMLLGPMDYTPGGFLNVDRDDFEPREIAPLALGTRCHQLAMFVVYQSPLQVLADCPPNYEGEDGFEFIKMVPTVWEESRFLMGELGDYIVMARKQGGNWYLGAMTDWDERELEIPLDFLGGGTWKATVWTDGRGMEGVDTEEMESVDTSQPLSVSLGSGGGCVAVFQAQ